MILSISDVAELKQAIADQISSQLHFHDGCGGQYFTIYEPTDGQAHEKTANYL